MAAAPYPPLDPDRPTLLGQVYSRLLANSLKLNLMSVFPDEHEVALVHGAGTIDERLEWLPLYEIDRSLLIDHLTSLYVPPSSKASGLHSLAETVAILRGPGGCPWDQQQTSASLRQGMLEEMAEVLEALDLGAPDRLREELGDLMFHVVMQAQIARESGDFSLAHVIADIGAKLKRRHPHVWGSWEVADSDEVIRNWEMLKAEERGQVTPSLLSGIPPTLPALAYSQKIQELVGQIGFDWTDIAGVFAKLAEEASELAEAISEEERQAELGDLLFVTAHLANWFGLDAESTLREANHRFKQRFRRLEELADLQDIDVTEASLVALNQLWDEAKADLTASPSDEEASL